MARLIECVPNFSEGRRPEVIDAICAAITSVSGTTLLDREMDKDHNRAVVTFVCHPSVVVEAAFRGYAKAAELIDMRSHSGEHPRMGACDVCPFIPLSDVAIDEAVELANQLAKRVGEELRIPVYLYEDAATSSRRKNLATVRSGEYEGIRDSIATDPDRIPDYGPRAMNLQAGASAIGVRFPLVAFNVYLGTHDLTVATRIADAVRSLTGGYRFVKALGFQIHARNQVQISMNLVNYTKTPIFRVFETIKSEAARYGVAVTSSEVIGLTPLAALVDVADFYLRLENFSIKQVLEERLRLIGSSGAAPTETFYDQVASSSPAPGGGSVAAASGALAAALTAMVCRLTVGKKQYAAVRDQLTMIRDQADQIRRTLEGLIVSDTDAFNAVMDAFKLPKGDAEQIASRDRAIQLATIAAAESPLQIMAAVGTLLPLLVLVAEHGNENSISDAGVAGQMARAALHSASYNVRINAKTITDERERARLTADMQRMLTESELHLAAITATVERKL